MGRHPETPFDKALARKTVARMTSLGAVGPTPAAWDRIKFTESRELSCGGIRIRAKEPNPY